jgi:hypothetical protein
MIKREFLTSRPPCGFGRRQCRSAAAGAAARFGLIAAVDLDHRAGLQQHRGDALEQRVGRNRLLEEFVDAEALRLQHIDAPATAAQHDDRQIGTREHGRRAHDANELEAVEQRHVEIEDDDVRGALADRVKPGNAVGGLDRVPNSQIGEQFAHDLAHEGVVVDDQHRKRSQPLLECLGNGALHASLLAGPLRRTRFSAAVITSLCVAVALKAREELRRFLLMDWKQDLENCRKSGLGRDSGVPPLLRRFTAQLAGGRHTLMERNWIKVEAVRRGQHAKLHEDAGEGRGVLERVSIC